LTHYKRGVDQEKCNGILFSFRAGVLLQVRKSYEREDGGVVNSCLGGRWVWGEGLLTCWNGLGEDGK